MKAVAFASSIMLVSALSVVVVPAQTRPRRVEQNTPVGSSPTTSTGQNAAGVQESSASSKATPEEISENETVRINTTLVTVPASVMDRNGRYIPDLIKEDFRIFENGLEQEVAYFAAVENPFTVVLMLDTSASTWSKLGQIRDAAIAFVDQLRPDDRVTVVSFARGLTIKCEATSDRQKIRKAIQSTGRGLSTHLYDAMDKMVRKHLNLMQGRKAVVLFTDGVDATSNDATYESTTHLAEELDALIYPILYDTYDPKNDNGGSSAPSSIRLPGILGRLPIPLPIPTQGGMSTSGGGAGSSRADYERGERYLRDLAALTGGRVYEARKDLSYLKGAFNDIAEELRRQYSLGYYPKPPARVGERRNIKVEVGRPGVIVRARGSYIYQAPAATPPQTTIDSAKDREPQPTAPVLQKKPFVESLGVRRVPKTQSL